MFTVEIRTAIMFRVYCHFIYAQTKAVLLYNHSILILLATLCFYEFAEAIAEARGKAQADSLRKHGRNTSKTSFSQW
jgi:high-affinity K+ transport system ATPase subunit B